MKQIVIVDDHLILRRGIAQILEDNPDLRVAGEAASGPELMTVLRRTRADAVLLDIALGDTDGFDVLRQLRQEFPHVPVLMLSVYPESQFGVRALKNGASGYLNKACSPQQLYEAIDRACSGRKYITPELAEHLACEVQQPVQESPLDHLSRRELQVLTLMAQGVSVGDIARQLCLSTNTISTYRARVFDKLGLHNAVELVSFAARHQLVAL